MRNFDSGNSSNSHRNQASEVPMMANAPMSDEEQKAVLSPKASDSERGNKLVEYEQNT